MIGLTRRIALLGAASLAACSQATTTAQANHEPSESEGRIAVPGGSVAWRRFGGGPKAPLLCAHGGPGVPSDFLEPLAGLGDERAIYLWDQLGCGRSDRPSDPALWTRARFVEELAQVRAALGLERMHYFGNSWGTMLGVDYLLERGQTGVLSAVLDGPVMSVSRYIADTRKMVAEQTPANRAAIEAAERTGQFETPAYLAATEAFYAEHLARHPSAETAPLLQRAFEGMGKESYLAMDGPSEFSITGSLKDYEREDDLARITIPVLYMSGEFDTCTPDASRAYAQKTPHGEVSIIPGAGHLVTIDEPQATNDAIRAFLNRVEAR